jgi:hypothetical protein
VVFQQPVSKGDLGSVIKAAMTARNDPNAPVPVEHNKVDAEEIARKPYQFLLVNVLREYLAFELRTQTPFPWDPERVYDDFGMLLLARSFGALFGQAGCCLIRQRNPEGKECRSPS